jgi:DNA-binding beta-propeller fold protein YncE/cytochrome c peroxidase
VANKRSGSLTVVDVKAARSVAEIDVGRALSDLVPLGDGRHMLAVDPTAGELSLLEHEGSRVRMVRRAALGNDPVQVAVSPDGRTCVVASTWARRLTVLSIAPGQGQGPELSFSSTLELPFSPRNVIYVQGGKRVVAADAFGGRLAVVDPEQGRLEAVCTIPAHNIRGLALSPDGGSLALTHQVLTVTAPTTRDDVHWGMMIGNHLRVIRSDKLVSAANDEGALGGGRLASLGASLDGAGDPAGVAYNRKGDLIVALSGVNEVAITLTPNYPVCRANVGNGPTAVAVSPDGGTAAVADSFDDTISIVNFDTCRRIKTIPLGPRRPLDSAERGERLFHDARLSHDNWLSCHSCHTDGHSNGLRSDTLGDSSFGAPKQVPSLLGVSETGPWAWIGAVDRLEDQVRKSITTTMRGRAPSDEEVADVSAFLRKLTPPPAQKPADTAAVARGSSVFTRMCATCHEPPTYTSPKRYDVGLVDEVGNRRFNPPSLLGVGRRDAFLHDGRAHSLEEVFTRFGHPGRQLPLAADEVEDLAAFLKTL